MFDGAPSTLVEIPERFSRRRIIVFCCSFILALAVGLSYVYTRPAEYRAVAQLQISPAGGVAEANEETKSPELRGDPNSFLTEVQVLTSRPLLEDVVMRLRGAGNLPNLGRDPVEAVQAMLHTEPVKDTQVVQLTAVGPDRTLVPRLVNTVAEVYAQRVADTFTDRAASTTADVTDEARSLQKDVLAKQHAVDDYGERYDIVSLNRNENDVLAKIDGLNRSYAEGNARLAKAQGNLKALRAAAAAGKPVPRAKDDAGLAAVEQRVAALREQSRALQRRYNQAYLALDADTKSLPTQITDLEQQLKEQREESGRAAISEAEDELASAQATVSELRKDLDDNQKGAREFAARLAQYKVMQDDLDHLQAMARAVVDRSTKLQSSVRERAPRVELLEAAAPSTGAWRPNYTQNALISVAGSLVFGLMATWFADFLGGPAPARPMQIQHSLALPSIERYAGPALRTLNTPAMPPASPPVQLAAPDPPARELDNSEIAALMANASAELRLAAAMLLTGLSPAEIAALSWDKIDFASGSLAIGGSSARSVKLEQTLGSLLAQHHRNDPDAERVLHKDNGDPMTIEELDSLVLYGAYDAGLDRPPEITSATLRHAYLAFLLRQGIRAADIGRIAGHIPQSEMMAYMQLGSNRTRLPLENIDRVHPALRSLSANANS